MLLSMGRPGLAVAQSPADTASFVLRNAKLQNLGGAVVGQPARLVLLNVAEATRTQTVVEQHWHDARLRPLRQARLLLRGKLELAAASGSADLLLLQLLSRDSLVLVAVDTLGRAVAQVRQPLAVRRGLLGVEDLSLPAARAFVTVEQQRQTTCRVVCRGPDLRVRWEKTFGPTPPAALAQAAADSTHLWLVLVADYEKRRSVSTAVCLELASGRELSRVDLTNEQARRVPSVVEMGPAHSLLVAGHAYDDDKALLRHTGDLFFQRLSPEGRVLTDYLTDFREEPRLHGAAAAHVQWQLLWPGRQGRLRLVGETYHHSSFGHDLGKAFLSGLTMGLTNSNSGTLIKPKDVVSVVLSPAGQVEQLRIVGLPLDHGEFAHPAASDGRVAARLAQQAGTFRARGLAFDSTVLVLRSPERIQTLNLQTGQLQPVRPAPAKGTADVMLVGRDYLIIGEAEPARRLFRVRRVPLPASAK